MHGYLLLLLLIHLLLMLCRLPPLSVRLLSFGAHLGTCKKQNPISVSWNEINTIHMPGIESALLQNFGWLPFAVAPHPLAFDALRPPSSFYLRPVVRCVPGDMQKKNPISVNWKEMNTIRMYRIERALLQKFAQLPFALAPPPLAPDALPPPPFFCPPPLVRCAPGDMQKTKTDPRQVERNEHDTYVQNREGGTAENCMDTFCCCSSSTCF